MYDFTSCQYWLNHLGVNALVSNLQTSPILGTLGQGYYQFCWGFISNSTGQVAHYIVYAVSLEFALELINQFATNLEYRVVTGGIYTMLSSQFPDQSMFLFQVI